MVILLFIFILPISEFVNTNDESIIINKLNNQANCWNSGNIDCFMKDYWHHDSLMYIGKNGITYGWQNTMDNYKVKYPTKKQMGHLEFELIKIEQLSDEHYFMVGRAVWAFKNKSTFFALYKKLNPLRFKKIIVCSCFISLSRIAFSSF